MIRPRRAEPTETTRAEALSDGVFAVAITLLALDLGRITANTSETLWQSFQEQWPTLLAFAGAFAFLGVAWTNHHHVFVRVTAMSRALNTANLLLLAGVSMVPWAAGALAEAMPHMGEASARQAIVLYAAVTAYGALSWMLVFHVLCRSPELLSDSAFAHGFRADRTGGLGALAATAAAAIVGYLWFPYLGVLFFFGLPVLFAFASEGFERAEAP